MVNEGNRRDAKVKRGKRYYRAVKRDKDEI